jgi:hypothetical protein
VPIDEITQVPMYYLAGHEDKYCSYNQIYPLKFKDFSLPEPVRTYAYEKVVHQDVFKYPTTIFKSALVEILGATSLKASGVVLLVLVSLF